MCATGGKTGAFGEVAQAWLGCDPSGTGETGAGKTVGRGMAEGGLNGDGCGADLSMGDCGRSGGSGTLPDGLGWKMFIADAESGEGISGALCGGDGVAGRPNRGCGGDCTGEGTAGDTVANPEGCGAENPGDGV